MKITVITPTGDRPAAFELCRGYMEQQTVQPDQWLVVDDGRYPMTNLRGIDTYIRREGGENEHTLRFNIMEALPHVEGDLVLFMEDDDWYDPKYIEYMRYQYNERRNWHPMIFGQSQAVYYDVKRRGWLAREFQSNICLCQIGFSASLMPYVKSCCEEPGFLVDVKLCKHPRARFLKDDRLMCVGIKHMPGRLGQSLGWKLKGHYKDKDMMELKSLIGDNYKNYEGYYEKSSNTE